MDFNCGQVLRAILVLCLVTSQASALVRRCWTCRSRSEYGDCRDPFAVNPNNLEFFPGVTPAPCASGWCGKIVEGDEVQYTVATERLCLPRPPDDNQERCAETHYKHRKVYMCFCMGDLCNSGLLTRSSIFIVLASVILHWINIF